MINCFNLTNRQIRDFDNIQELPPYVSGNLTVIFSEASSFDHTSNEDVLIITLSQTYSVKSPAKGESWQMSVAEDMLNQLTFFVEAFYEHSYLPFKESRVLYLEAQQFRSFFDTMPANMYVKDAESRFIRVNDNWKNHVGVAIGQDVTGKTDFEIFDHEHAQQAFNDEKEIIETGVAKAGYEEAEKLPDGSELWTLSTKIPIKDVTGNIIGVSGISYDITKFKNTERHLQEANEELKESLKKLKE